MRTSITQRVVITSTFFSIMLGAVLSAAGAPIQTNWAAFNDHRPGPVIPPHVPVRTNWGTHRWVTTYDMGAPADTTGNLMNFLDGQQLPVTATFTRTGAPDDFGTVSEFGPRTNSPAGELFFGIVDLSNNGIVGVDQTDAAYVTITFNNLNPVKRYLFRGTAARGGSYLPRWSVATITNADGFIPAHVTGAGSPGVITSNEYPANLGVAQAAWNSGDNVEGDLIGWDFIDPGADGSFAIICEQYLGPHPQGTADSDYAYGFAAMLLAEVELSAPVITTNPPTPVTVEQNRPFSLTVAATGTPLLFQWYKEGLGALPGATFATYTVAQAALSDAGDYYAVVHNPLASVTSTVAHVVVNQDVTAPGVATVFSYPTFDPLTQNASLDQIIVEYNELVDMTGASSPARYVISGGGNPATVTVTNNTTVVLRLSTPLADDTDYTVTISGVADIVGNVAASIVAPFHSWIRGPGNGLLFEAFDAGTGVDVITLTSHPNFPNNPFLGTNLWIFDTRAVFPDDTHEQYGGRVRGVFIPPVSGNWVFFLRTYDRGQVFLNPTGLDPANAQLILAETTGNEPRDWNKFQSTPFALRAGQAYYLEGLYKADAGTDVIKVGARLAGTGLPELGFPVSVLDVTNALQGPMVAAPYAPRDLGGPITILQEPADTLAEENHVAYFSALATNISGLPIFYQWYRDGSPIPGANLATYSARVTTADNGATFRVEMSKLGSVTNSRTATLQVIPDITAPTLVAGRGSYPLTIVIVSFSEQLEVASAEDEFNYNLDPVRNVDLATLDPTGTNVILTLQTPLAVGSTNLLTVSAVLDVSGHPLVATSVVVRAWVLSRGFALEQLYLNIGTGTAVADLTGNSKYPNLHDVLAWKPTLEGPTDRYDAYGVRLTGWVAPPVNGDYLFYICSDDNSELRLSPDADPINVALIAQETSYNGDRTWTGDRTGGTRGTPPSNISTNPVPLTAGQTYAFEVLAKDGTGGDNVGVAWQPPGQPVPADGSPGIAGAHLWSLADPVGASVTITQQPANYTGSLPGMATFSVGATATLQGAANTNLTYVWQRDDGAGFADILGAYSSTYSVALGAGDAGARFRVLVFSPGVSATSDIATIGAALPRVSISRQGNVIRISWPLPGTGITLQQTPTLEGNPPPWTTVPPGTYQTDATSVYIEVTSPTGNAFYRLSQSP